MELLSEDLKYWRAEMPDEWKMDEFIRKSIALELKVAELQKQECIGFVDAEGFPHLSRHVKGGWLYWGDAPVPSIEETNNAKT